MAEKKKPFDLGDTLADVLGSVPGSDTGREQITYLDINAIDPDKENFYSMDGLDELAANIELVGLQQPLRVRENPDMPGRYLIVSGHRRRAALWTLYEETPEKWGSVPCIVEPAAASEELQQLRLIYANAGTRQMSSADLSRQAEQVEQLLYKLKEQGYDFPGRMRDHVAEACKVSKTKLATLKVIREKLIPELRQLWEEGALNETCAYRLAQEDSSLQKDLLEDNAQKGIDISKAPEWSIAQWILDRKRRLSTCVTAEKDCGDKAADYTKEFESELKLIREAIKQEWLEGLCGTLGRRSIPLTRMEAINSLKDAYRNSGLYGANMWSYDGKPNGLEVRPPHAAKFLARWTDIFDQLALMAISELHKRIEKDRVQIKPATPTAEPLQFRSGHPDHDAVCWCIFSYGNGESGCSGAIWKNNAWNFYTIGATIDAECIGWIELPDYEGALRK